MPKPKVVLTSEEHLKFIHLCGWKGSEVELFSNFCWTGCKILKECQMNHCIIPLDVLSDAAYELEVDRVIQGRRWIV